jgi:hypothetical protein
MRDRQLRRSLFRVGRVLPPWVVLAVLGARGASVGAQAPKQVTDLPPCPTAPANPADPKKPCVAPGNAAGPATPAVPTGEPRAGSSGGGGGGSGQTSAPAEVLGPYRVVKVMDRAGEAVEGLVCAIDRPFVVHMQTRPATFDIKFEPTDKARGMWTYAYDIPRAGESHRAMGDHIVSPPAADGTRSLTIDGPDFVTFHGFAGPFQMHYVMGLVPVAAPTGACGR